MRCPPRRDRPNRYLAAVAERAASGVDARAQRGLGNNPPVPDGCDQVVLADHAIAIAHQIDQQIEYLWFNWDQRAFAAQLPAACIQHKIFEQEQHLRPRSADYQEYRSFSSGSGEA
jgi:hypothetical protein